MRSFRARAQREYQVVIALFVERNGFPVAVGLGRRQRERGELLAVAVAGERRLGQRGTWIRLEMAVAVLVDVLRKRRRGTFASDGERVHDRLRIGESFTFSH